MTSESLAQPHENSKQLAVHLYYLKKNVHRNYWGVKQKRLDLFLKPFTKLNLKFIGKQALLHLLFGFLLHYNMVL